MVKKSTDSASLARCLSSLSVSVALALDVCMRMPRCERGAVGKQGFSKLLSTSPCPVGRGGQRDGGWIAGKDGWMDGGREVGRDGGREGRVGANSIEKERDGARARARKRVQHHARRSPGSMNRTNARRQAGRQAGTRARTQARPHVPTNAL
jgi:hypothetical protein